MTPKTTTAAQNPVSGYCVKCRATREMKDAKSVTMKNGKPAVKGSCPVCGTGIYRIGVGAK